MKYLIRSWLTIILLVPFYSKCKAAKEILFAKDIFNHSSYEKFEFRLFSDSTYIFNYLEKEWANEKNEKFRGRFHIKSDTIIFFPFRFKFKNCEKAVIKEGFIEFLDGEYPFRIKIQRTTLNAKVSFDTLTFNKYAFFSYDRNHYNCFDGGIFKSIALDNSDLIKLDSILTACIKKSKLISYKPNQYYKQCIAIIDSSGDKIVWINLNCGNMYYKYRIDYVRDGGDCYAELKVNLTKLKWYDLQVNGYEGG